ncbi:MAG TPA: thymidylate synthase [Acetobacteraceae bacterium]|nr:thymidylate synthase [Acetobacteraceae bacterium]
MTAALRSGRPAFPSLDEAQRWVLNSVLNSGERSSPRGIPTLELLAQSFTIEHPRCRRVMTPERGWSFPLAIGEFCRHASGSSDLSSIGYYAPRWKEFSDDQKRISGSCYGARIFGTAPDGTRQWDRLVDLLSVDPDSRRAVFDLQSYGPTLTNMAKDVSCTTSMQFFVRHHRLHTIVNMRSNDVVWGLPYDIFLFTMLQELLACTLGLELGHYHHFVGSLHLYERHVRLAERVLRAQPPPSYTMPPMDHPEQLPAFLSCEAAIRMGGAAILSGLSPYWRSLADVLVGYATRARPLAEAL